MPLRSLILAGVNYRTAPIETRECLALEGESLAAALGELQDAGADQVVLLSTCNRTEVYALGIETRALEGFFRRRLGEAGQSPEGAISLLRGREAVRHLFRVAAGLESQVLGESEVLGQVKKAWAVAREEGSTASFLDTVFQRAVVAGKRVRAETGLGRQVLSVASLAVRLARQERPDFSAQTVLVVGTGEMGQRIVQELASCRPKKLYVISHTLSNAQELARAGGGEALLVGQFGQVLREADIVFTATWAAHPIVDKAWLEPAEAHREGRTLSVFDLGVPRNASADIRDLGYVTLRDIDDLEAISATHRRSREREIPAAQAIVDEELEALLVWCRQRTAAPLIATLRERAEAIRQRQLARALRELGEVPEDQREAIERMTVHLVRQLLHFPICELRDASGEEQMIAVAARLVGALPEAGTRAWEAPLAPEPRR
jgi:glutamyl-tRNA reductase